MQSGRNMKEILVACGDVDLLKQILGHLPPNTFKPVATKNGGGVAQKVAGRPLALAIVHLELADGNGPALLQDLRSTRPELPVLLLTADNPPLEGPFHRALRYPIPGPVLRNAISSLAATDSAEQDLDRWKAFYQEVKARLAKAPEQSYFQLLGVPNGAPHHLLVKAFDHLSMRYHPDRYNQYRGESWGDALHEKVNMLYKLFTEAYGVVSDRSLRTRYEEALARGELRLDPESVNLADKGPRPLHELAQTQKARRFLQMAQTELAKGNTAAALQNLQFALSMEPENLAIQKKLAEFQA
jgi:hypothetical protein